MTKHTRVVKAENATIDGWYNMQMEPGSPGKTFDFDAGCRRLHFFGHANIRGGIKDDGTDSTWLIDKKSSFPDVTLKEVTLDKVRLANTATASNNQGKITRKLEVFDASGRSLGFIPIYDDIR